MHPSPVLCSSILVAETGATEFDAHLKTGVKLSWTCSYKQAGQVLKVEGELCLTGIIRIPMETACRRELTTLFYSEKWLRDNRTLLKTHSLFDCRCCFLLGEIALPFFALPTWEQNKKSSQSGWWTQHNKLSGNRQQHNCWPFFAVMPLGCNCTTK